MYLRKKQFIKSNVRSSQIYIMIIFVIFSIQILMRTVSSESCDKLFPKDNGLTMVRSIRQGSDLNNYLSGTYTFVKTDWLFLIGVWLPFNNSSIYYYFSEISDGKSLLRRSNKDNVLFKLDVINGTIWLSHSGDVRSFSPVLGIPPATSSDMSLATAMQKLSEVTLNMSNVKSIH